MGIKLIFGLSVELKFCVVVEIRGREKFLVYGNLLIFVICKIMKFFMKNLVDVGDVYWGRGFIYIFMCIGLR